MTNRVVRAVRGVYDGRVIPAVPDVANRIIRVVPDVNDGRVIPAVPDVANRVIRAVPDAVNRVIPAVPDVANRIIRAVPDVYDGRVIPAVPDVADRVIRAVPDVYDGRIRRAVPDVYDGRIPRAVPDAVNRVVRTMGVVMDQVFGTTVSSLGDRVGGAAQVIRNVPQVCHRVICTMRGNSGTREARKQEGSGTSTQHQSHCGAQGQPLRCVALRHRHGLSLPA